MSPGKTGRVFQGCSSHDLNGNWVAYDVSGLPLGEVMYKKGVLFSRKKFRRSGREYGNAKRRNS